MGYYMCMATTTNRKPFMSTIDQAIERYERNGCEVAIGYDSDPPNPRTEFDNVGKLCFQASRKYLSPNEAPFEIDWETYKSLATDNEMYWACVEKRVRRQADVAVLLPVYRFEHSGVAYSVKPFSCGWDSGRVGFIYCTKEDVQNEWGGDLAKAESYLAGEVDEYSSWANGSVYEFVVTFPEACGQSGDGETEACGGFFDMEGCQSEANSVADNYKPSGHVSKYDGIREALKRHPVYVAADDDLSDAGIVDTVVLALDRMADDRKTVN